MEWFTNERYDELSEEEREQYLRDEAEAFTRLEATCEGLCGKFKGIRDDLASTPPEFMTNEQLDEKLRFIVEILDTVPDWMAYVKAVTVRYNALNERYRKLADEHKQLKAIYEGNDNG